MDYGKKETQKKLNKLEKEIEMIYRQALKEIKEEIKKYPNLDKILSIKDKNERLRMAKRRSDFQLLTKHLSKIIQGKNKISIDLINDKMIDIYGFNFNWSAYFLENLTGFDLSFILYSREAVKALLLETTPVFTKMAYKGAKDLDTILRDLRRGLAVSIIKGESIDQIAKRISKITEKNKNNSIRVARTETTRIENSGRIDAFKHGEDMGLELRKQWISTIDSRTRDRHLELNMKSVDLDKSFAYGLKYPGDPHAPANQTINCRCTVVTEFVGVKKTDFEMKLDEDLKRETFKEWERRKKNGK